MNELKVKAYDLQMEILKDKQALEAKMQAYQQLCNQIEQEPSDVGNNEDQPN